MTAIEPPTGSRLSHHLMSHALMSMIVPQGLYVRARALQLPEAAGDRVGTGGDGPCLRVLIVGDSSAAGVGVDSQEQALSGQLVKRLSRDHCVEWTLAARIGATAGSVMSLLDQIEGKEFDIAITALGVNDAKNGVSLARWISTCDALYARLQDEFGVKLICASGMPPVKDFPLLHGPLRWALSRRAQLFDLAHRGLVQTLPGVKYLQGPARLLPEEMSVDGFHPAAPVYREWARLADDLIREHWPQVVSRPARVN